MTLGAVFLIVGTMVAAVLLFMTMFAQLYRKAGLHEALVVFGVPGNL